MARLAALVSLIVMLAGCGGGSSSADPGPAPAAVTVSGQVTFDFVPVVAGARARLRRDGRAPCARRHRRAAAKRRRHRQHDDGRNGQLFVRQRRANTDVALRVRAEMLRVGAPSWDFRVVDNVNGDALYTLAGAVFNTGAANVTRNLHAASGWTGAAYTATRSAAPFAILDVAYDAVQLVLTAAPSTAFPALRFNWSTQNVPVAGTGPGEIGSSRYRTDVGHLSRRRGRSRHRRVRPARHRARVRSLSRASVLALGQRRRPARADGSDRLPCRLRRSLGQRIRGDGDGAARLRRRAQRGSGASVQLRSRATRRAA